MDSMINYVLNTTGQHFLYYVGYSEGTLTMFAKLSIDQLFTQKVRILLKQTKNQAFQ